MWNTNEKKPIWEYLLWTFLIAGLSNGICILGVRTGVLSGAAGKNIIMTINTLGTAFSPMYAVYILLKKYRKISGVKDFCKLILHTADVKITIAVIFAFGAALFGATMLCGTRTDYPWFIIIPAIPLMILGGGLEEVGWRGFLQPALEKRYPFIMATMITSVIWAIWHFPLWFINGANHSNYNIFAFVLQLTVLSFVLATIYKVTKSVFACIIFHAWGNAIGAIYNWEVFATLPVSKALVVYDCVMIAASIVICTFIDRKNKISLTTFQKGSPPLL